MVEYLASELSNEKSTRYTNAKYSYLTNNTASFMIAQYFS